MKLITGFWFKLKDQTGLKLKTDEGRWYEITTPFSPYFFIRESDLSKADLSVDPSDSSYVDPQGNRCVKIKTTYPSDVPPLRRELRQREIQTFEADVPFLDRFTIDKGIEYSDSPKVAWFDVEMDSSKGFPKPEKPEGRILSVGAIDDQSGEEFFFSADSEPEILREFQNFLKRYDLAVGFNSNEFDVPYLRARSRLIGVPFDFRLVQWGDLLRIYRIVKGKERPVSLASVSKEEAGVSMSKPPSRGAVINRWFDSDRGRLREYNLDDCRALKAVNDRLELVQTLSGLSSMAHISYESAHNVIRMVDAFLFRYAQHREPRIVFPTRSKGLRHEGYAGAFVMEPSPGLHEGVTEFDFHALYPSLIRTFNIGPETVGGSIRTESLNFKREPRSLFAECLEELDRRREESRDREFRQLALKIVSNVFYGVIGRENSRYYNRQISESVTLTGRQVVKKLISLLAERGLKPIYADTDGSYSTGGEGNLDSFNLALREWVLANYSVPPEYYCMRLERKGTYAKVYFAPGREKKRLVADQIFPKRGRKVVGFEVKRHNVPPLVAKIQEKIFGIILSGKGVAEVRKMLDSAYGLLMEGLFDEDLIIESGTMEVEKYRVNPPQARAAKKAIERGIMRPGETVRYIITDVGRGGLEVDPVADSVPKITPRAREYYWRNRVLPIVERLVKLERQTGLGDFMGSEGR